MPGHRPSGSAGGGAAGVAGRKLVDIAQAARGRTPLKYELEVVPFCAVELPSGLERVCFTWERGSKVFVTEAEPVNPKTRAVFWSQFLKQTATLYREGGRLLPKEFSFKIQHVRGGGGGGGGSHGGSSHESRKTIGKVKLDMAQFCSEDAAPAPQEVFLQLKPAGKLKVSIKAAWLKDARVDLDALTEVSVNTHRSTEAGEGGEAAVDEQDLSGFDHLDPLSAPSTHGAGGSSPPPGHRANGASSSGNGPARAGRPESPRQPQPGAAAPQPSKLKPGPIAPFAVGPSPSEAEREARWEQEQARLAAFQAAEAARMRVTIEEQLRTELNDVLSRHGGFSWRSLCCCWPRRPPQVSLRSTKQELASLADGEPGARRGASMLSPAVLPL